VRLADKTAIITGVGAGIGQAIALRFAEEGARLLLNDINQAAGQATLEKVKGLGADAVLVAADISQEAGARSISQSAVGRFSGIDILVNNAADFTQKNVDRA